MPESYNHARNDSSLTCHKLANPSLNRVLIVRLGSLGDIIHAIPAAAAIRRTYPNAAIDWLVDVRHRELLDLVPVIDRRIAIRDRAISGRHGQRWVSCGAPTMTPPSICRAS